MQQNPKPATPPALPSAIGWAALVIVLRDLASEEHARAHIHSNPGLIAKHDARAERLDQLAEEIQRELDKQPNDQAHLRRQEPES